MKKKMTPREKIEALCNAGVDVSKLFSFGSVGKEDKLVRINEDGLTCTEVFDNDPIFKAILNGDTVNHPSLYRRWVMAQVFHMLSETDHKGNVMGFDKALRKKHYKYQWKMVVEELRVQARMLKNGDIGNYIDRQRWFNSSVVLEMAQDYLDNLKVFTKKPKHCKGVPYARVFGRDIFLSDMNKKVYTPIRKAMMDLAGETDAHWIYKKAERLYEVIKSIGFYRTTPLSKAFIDAYKGAGAYYTMQNMILFHGCRFPGMNETQSMEHLTELNLKPKMEGWRLFGIMKDLIKTNNINIIAKMQEWRH